MNFELLTENERAYLSRRGFKVVRGPPHKEESSHYAMFLSDRVIMRYGNESRIIGFGSSIDREIIDFFRLFSSNEPINLFALDRDGLSNAQELQQRYPHSR